MIEKTQIIERLHAFKALIDNALKENGERTAAANLAIWNDLTQDVGEFVIQNSINVFEPTDYLKKSFWQRFRLEIMPKLPPQYTPTETAAKLCYECARSQFLTWKAAIEGSDATVVYLIKSDSIFLRLGKDTEREVMRNVGDMVKTIQSKIRQAQ